MAPDINKLLPNIPSMNGPRTKFERAMEHANNFEVIYETWRKSILDKPPVDFYKVQSSNKLIFSIKAPPPDSLLPFIIGDFIHNLRASLDHLTSQLALIEGHDIKKHSTLAFPMYTNVSDYNKYGTNKINKFIKNTSVLKTIEEVQPYHHINPTTDPLWLVSELDNIDKHRILLVIAPRINKRGEASLVPGFAKNDKPPADSNPYTMGIQIEIQPNNPVFTEKSASHHISVWCDTTLVLTDTGLTCDGWPIQELIRILSGRVQEILNIFESRFFTNK